MLVFRIQGFYFVHKLINHDGECTSCGKMCQVIKRLPGDVPQSPKEPEFTRIALPTRTTAASVAMVQANA